MPLRGSRYISRGVYLLAGSASASRYTAQNLVQRKNVKLNPEQYISIGCLVRNQEILDAGGQLNEIDDSITIHCHPSSKLTKESFVAKLKKIQGNELSRLVPEWRYSLCAAKDLALLELCDFIEKTDTPRLRNLVENPLQTGELVFIIGNSEDFILKVGYIAEAKHKDPLVSLGLEMILVNMSVNEGDSGSALFDARGDIVGIINKRSTVKENHTYALSAADIAEKFNKFWDVIVR
jgi:hypothetical protein